MLKQKKRIERSIIEKRKPAQHARKRRRKVENGFSAIGLEIRDIAKRAMEHLLATSKAIKSAEEAERNAVAKQENEAYQNRKARRLKERLLPDTQQIVNADDFQLVKVNPADKLVLDDTSSMRQNEIVIEEK